MSMGSEIAAAHEARGLQKVLLAAVDKENGFILDFCKEQIYPLYRAALMECWDPTVTESDAHKKIVSNFGAIKY